MRATEESVRAALRQVCDPELMVNVVDLGLIYQIEISNAVGKANVRIAMTMTSPACPVAPRIIAEAREAVEDLGEHVGRVDVELVMSPPWTPQRMTDEARDELGIF